MVKVWVATREVAFEGSEVVGLATTVRMAKRLVREHMDYISGDQKLSRWWRPDARLKDYYAADVVGNKLVHYQLSKMQVYTDKDL